MGRIKMCLTDLIGKDLIGELNYTKYKEDIHEGQFSVGTSQDSKGFLHTKGIFTCMGLTIYDKKERTGLFAHIYENFFDRLNRDYLKICKFFASVCSINNAERYKIGIFADARKRDKSSLFPGMKPHDRFSLSKYAVRRNFGNSAVLIVYNNPLVCKGVTLDLAAGCTKIGVNKSANTTKYDSEFFWGPT